MGRLLANVLLVLCIVFVSAPQVSAGQSDPDPEELGIVSDTEWESPQFGTTIEWSENWEPQFDGLTYSNLDDEIDGLSLLGEHGVYNAAVLGIRDETIESYRDFLLSFREEANADFEFELIESGDTDDTSYFAYTAIQDDKEFTVLVEVFYLPDELIGYSELLGWTFNLPELFDDIQAGIAIDGETPFGYYFTEETIPIDPDAVDPEAEHVTGLIDEQSYKGPLFGAEVTWDDPWAANPDITFSNGDSEAEVITLATTDTNFLITFAASDDSLADVLETRYAEFEDAGLTEDLTIIDQGTEGGTAWLAASGVQQDAPIMILLEATWLDEDETIVQVLEFTAWTEDIEAGFESAQETIDINGDEPFQYFPSKPMLDEIAA
jgi:hypothetical protein